MKAALHHGFGGPDVLAFEDVPEPTPGPGDVLVAVRASALNRLDILQRCGPALLPGFSLPHIAGMDVAGVVVSTGGEVEGVGTGDRVLVNPAIACGACAACRSGDDALCSATRVVGGNRAGGYAELCCVPATHVHHLPSSVSFDEAATIPTAFSTAWRAIVRSAGLRLGETLLVHAAASGVSVAAIQLAKRSGARVIATAGSEEKLELARRLGADVVINNRRSDLVAAVREETGGRGVDVAFDHVGPALFEPSLRALRPRGRLVFCGTTTGTRASFELPFAYHFGLRLIGVEPHSRADFGEMLDYYFAGGFEAVVGASYPLAEARGAHEAMEAGKALGKIVLRP